MYLGFILILIGVATLLGSLSAFVTPILMFIILEIKFIPMEEKNLEKAFGKEYFKYKHKVRKWI